MSKQEKDEEFERLLSLVDWTPFEQQVVRASRTSTRDEDIANALRTSVGSVRNAFYRIKNKYEKRHDHCTNSEKIAALMGKKGRRLLR